MKEESKDSNKFSNLEDKIRYKFSNKEHLLLALTHSSYANENKSLNLISNERIEFLGDSILNITISEYLYKNFTEFSEGEMTKVRAHIVCEDSLAKHAKKIFIGDYLMLGKGEEIGGGRKRAALLSDSFEALIGAIYLDSGLESAKKFILDVMKKLLNSIIKGEIILDYKTKLQEILQKKNDVKIKYEVVDEIGPDHDKTFISEVHVNDFIAGRGEGKSKKESEQNAAKEALEKIENN